jgi:hypothetical protein
MKTIATLLSLIIATATFATNNPAPANSLKVSVNSNRVELNFNANGNTRFDIERSFYSNEFSTIQTINLPFAGVNQLKVQDNAAELAGRAIAYYRIKTTDANGNVSYSNITTVQLKAAETAAAAKVTLVHFSSNQNGNATITLKTLTGKTISTLNTLVNNGTNSVELTNLNGIEKGIYAAVVTVNGVTVDTQKVIAE